MTDTDDRPRATRLTTVLALSLAACVLYGVGAGTRGDVGILLHPLADRTGLSYASVSLCIAVMQLLFGASQPFFGMLSIRRSNRFVLELGIGLLAASFLGMIAAHSFWPLMLSLGVLFGLGTGAVNYGLILTSLMRYVGPSRAMLVAGMLNAAAGLGSFTLSPVLEGLVAAGGIPLALSVMCAPLAALVPIALLITRADPPSGSLRAPRGTIDEGESRGPIRTAFASADFRFLLAGFSTCGFHMVIIESHLYSQFVSYGIDTRAAAWAFSVYGIATIAGALLSGYLATRFHKGRLLGGYYGFRAIWTLLFLFAAPKNVVTAVIFNIGLGLTGDATVAPTSGLVNQWFSLTHVSTIIGVLFFGHQIGAFFSAWLGGILVSRTGSYVPVWLIDVALCAFAAVMSLLVADRSRGAATVEA